MPTKRIRIASQACERCREKRTKCDNQQPRCGRCLGQNANCTYGTPAATRLDEVEQKVVELSDAFQELKDKFQKLESDKSISSASSISETRDDSASTDSYPNIYSRMDRRLKTETHVRTASSEHLTVPHRVILWPCIRKLLMDFNLNMEPDLAQISEEGTRWFIRLEMEKHPRSIPHHVEPTLSSLPPTNEAGTFPPLVLDQDRVMTYTNAYFQTFNVLLPILDHDMFVQTTLESLAKTGYIEGDIDVVLALFVFALGELASEGTSGQPIGISAGIPSGFRGGEPRSPPGLYLFNQARKRLGFVDCLCTLENAQIYVLQASYYAANGHYLEHWKSISAASTTMQTLLQSRNCAWSSGLGDMISRAYWACLFQEDFYHLDLDFPPTGIQQYEDSVPLPLFISQVTSSTFVMGLDEGRRHFEHHFLAMIALRRLIVRIHTTVHEPFTTRAESPNDCSGGPVPIIREMNRQLDSWRSLLPKVIQWEEDQACEYYERSSTQQDSLFSSQSQSLDRTSLFGTQENVDMLTAQLRTRYYYARYLLLRPYVYKGLHHPKHMSIEDEGYCADALNSMCLWPSLMAPQKLKKRLIPHLYAWTQNCLSILLIFKSVEDSSYLKELCQERVGLERIQETVSLMLEWISDTKQVDGTAEWGWKIVEPLFASG